MKLTSSRMRSAIESLACLVLLACFASTSVHSAQITPFTGITAYVNATQSDGKTLVGGGAYRPLHPGYDFAVGRLNVDGSVDKSFNGTGLVRVPVWGDYEFVYAIAVQPDGRIVIAGSAPDPARPQPECTYGDCESYVTLARLGADGSIDATFNAGKPLILRIGDPVKNELFFVDMKLRLQPDASIVVSGWASTDPAQINTDLARVRSDGSLDTGFAGPMPVSVIDFVTVIEYYSASLDHYFMTAERTEFMALDRGEFGDWQRTRSAFHAHGPDAAGAPGHPVCRFYGRPSFGLNTHFYTANPLECDDLQAKAADAWLLESRDVFRAMLPNPVTGACPVGYPISIYRLFNNRSDVNHRFASSRDDRNAMVAKGYIAEGYGPESVSMCAAM